MKTTLIKILIRLTGASRQLIDLILPILRDSAGRLLADLAPVALEVVKSLADSPHSGAQKREAAARLVQSHAIAEGRRASLSLVNLAVELAVQNLKSAK